MNSIYSYLLVAGGGALGSMARYAISAFFMARMAELRFPIGTFVVNITGCLLIGLLAGLAVKHHFFSPAVRLFLFTGLAGGFTTFSTFGLETFYLLRRGAPLLAGSYIAASIVVGLLLLWLGFSVIAEHDV